MKTHICTISQQGCLLTLIMLLACSSLWADYSDVQLTDADLPADVVTLLTEAGNAATDMQCLTLMQQVQNMQNLPVGFQDDLSRLLKLVSYWATGLRDGATQRDDNYLAFMIKIRYADNTVAKVCGQTVLGDLYRWYVARTRLGHYLQAYGQYANKDELRLETLANLDRDFKQLYQRFPENKAIGLWAGQLSIPWPTQYSDDPNAPKWANEQRRCLEGLTDVIHWWIDNRQLDASQLDEGAFGTGWGDDIEMWRVWLPILGGFDDPKLNLSQAKLSAGLMAEDYLSQGYSSKMSDVEHTSEDTSDVITPMMLINREDPQWLQRALRIAQIAQDKWMGNNQRGQRQHIGAFFNVNEIDPAPIHAADTTYHCRIYQPVMLAWQRGQAPDFAAYFTQWIDTWVDASMREERGKPAGILPTAIGCC